MDRRHFLKLIPAGLAALSAPALVKAATQEPLLGDAYGKSRAAEALEDAKRLGSLASGEFETYSGFNVLHPHATANDVISFHQDRVMLLRDPMDDYARDFAMAFSREVDRITMQPTSKLNRRPFK